MSRNRSGFTLASCACFVLGIIILLVTICVLYFIEDSAVLSYLTREFAKNNYVETASDHIQTENEDKLVLVYGKITTDQILEDTSFNVKVDNCTNLSRIVEMYQWEERRTSHTVYKGKHKRTEYSYTVKEGWHDYLINSDNFQKHKVEYKNPNVMPFQSGKIAAKNVKMGVYTVLASGIENPYSDKIRYLSKEENVELDSSKIKIPVSSAILKDNKILYNYYEEEKIKKTKGVFNVENISDSTKSKRQVDESYPQIGDTRIYYKKNPVCEATILARQSGDKLIPYKSKYLDIFEAKPGKANIDEILSYNKSGESFAVWFFRIGSYFLFCLGFYLVIFQIKNEKGCLMSLSLSLAVVTGMIAILWFPHHLYFAVISLVLMIIGLILATLSRNMW